LFVALKYDFKEFNCNSLVDKLNSFYQNTKQMKTSALFPKITRISLLPEILFILLILVSFSSCKKDDNSSGSSSSTVLNSTIQQGSWRVTSYIDSGNDETSHYTNYAFNFQSGGVVTAAKSGSTVSGTWSSGNDDSTLKLVLNFGTTDPFQELNDDWHVVQQTSTMIKLEDVSGGNGGIDYLTFEKN